MGAARGRLPGVSLPPPPPQIHDLPKPRPTFDVGHPRSAMSSPEPGSGPSSPAQQEDEALASPHGASPSPGPDADLMAMRSAWQFGAVVNFTRIFSQALRFRPYAAELLEQALLHPYSSQHFLSEFFFKLVRQDATLPASEADYHAWETLLHARVASNWADSDWAFNPLQSRSFFEVPPSTRVRAGRGAHASDR